MNDDITDDGLLDLSDLTLRDLRALQEDGDDSFLTRALARILASDDDGHHGFQASI